MNEEDVDEIPVRIEAYKYASRQKTIDSMLIATEK
jgi:hypothetical protein